MTTYVEWKELYSDKRTIVTLRLPVRDVVRLQFQRYPCYLSAEHAVADFTAVNWASLVEAPNVT